VVRNYVRFEAPDRVQSLMGEMAGLLRISPSEADLELLLGPFTTYRPTDEGMTTGEWLVHLIDLLPG
jgi:hypothetical protein